MKPAKSEKQLLEQLRIVLDKPRGRYKELNGARTLGDYLHGDRPREDEELLTEPILADLIERVLGFPGDAYFPQLGRSGLKPDFTPHDLVAHRFVLDAKSSTQDLAAHEPQIRRYIDQRQLDYGVLFNLREVRVYRRGKNGADKAVSFSILPLWQIARGEALPDAEAVGRFVEFVDRFRYHELDTAAKVERIRQARSWTERESRGETIEIDLDFLVDRLRGLSRELQDDAASQPEALERTLRLQPGREKSLLRELELIALDLSPGLDLTTLPQSTAAYPNTDGLPGRVWRQYLLRVSQLALTRILLYRSWEDVEFVDSYLYDGGFEQWYERLDKNLQKVLREAFAHGRERYHWLYGSDNNYDWYRPRDEALVEVLYALVPVPLGKLDADVLGGLYESYVDEIDRDRLGQFFTPRAVVRFMLDRAGYSEPDAVFEIAGDKREPKRILDFATGSGGFLVEAARRVIDLAGLDLSKPRDLDDGLAAIVRGFHGAEISPFPYYLTEINLLLQVSRLLGAMRLSATEPPPFVLGVVHTDTLSARPAHDRSLEGLDPESKPDRDDLVTDDWFGLVPLDAEKRESFQRMREDDAFDLVIGNPPYVFEAGNRILFKRLRALPAWRDVYRGKSDYLYYFLQLAAEKVAPGGRLCVITPAGWMNAGNADWLRERIAGTLRLDELFLFGSYRLFAPERARRADRRRAPTPTIESAILIATKADVPTSHELRIVALEDEAAVAAALGGSESRVPDRDALLTEMATRADGRAGRRKGIHVHRVRQRDLDPAHPWPIKHGVRDTATRVVLHLEAALADDQLPVERLDRRWHIFQGIQTGADAYTPRIQRRLSRDVKQRLEAGGARTGDPIMELPPGSENDKPWGGHPQFLARSPESRAILYGTVDEADYAHLVWIDRTSEVPEAVVAALDPWRSVLASRAEFERNKNRRWFETAWPRDRNEMLAPKVIALYRTDRGRFAFDESGKWQPSIKTTLCTAREDGLSVVFLCGVLNSELLDLWYAVRGKHPRDVWRNYEPKPMARMPYRHIETIGGESPGLAQLDAALKTRRATVEDLLAPLAANADAAAAADGECAAAVERLVRAIARNRNELLPHRDLVPDLGATVKDPWRTGPVAVDTRALIATLPTAQTLSVRLDPNLHTKIDTDGTLGRAKREGGVLVFRRSRQVTATVTGSSDRLDLLENAVEGKTQLLPADLEAQLLPRDPSAVANLIEARAQAVTDLLAEGRTLVETVERLVCRLYGLPRELEDAVVEHAVARAASRTPSDE